MKDMKGERGYVLVLCLLFFLLTTLMGIALIHTSSFGVTIAGNGLESQKAFWLAESGIQDARDKLSGVESVEMFKQIPGLSNPVTYAGGNYTLTISNDSFDPTRRVIVRSVGTRDGGASKTVEAVIQKFTFGLPGALYSKSLVTINSNKTYIDGNDGCGGTDRPAIVTTCPTIDFQNGNLWGNGTANPVVGMGGIDTVTEMNSTQNYPLLQYVMAFKNYANYSTTDASIQGSTIGTQWGSDEINILPAIDGKPQRIQLLGSPEPNVVYLDPPLNSGNGKKEVNLNNVNGHGLLLVNGSVNIWGGFNWYGVIIASGGLTFSGQGGQDKNITGAVMAGETGVVVDVNVTGSVAILYCGAVSNYLRDLPTAIMVSWKEIKG